MILTAHPMALDGPQKLARTRRLGPGWQDAISAHPQSAPDGLYLGITRLTQKKAPSAPLTVSGWWCKLSADGATPHTGEAPR